MCCNILILEVHHFTAFTILGPLLFELTTSAQKKKVNDFLIWLVKCSLFLETITEKHTLLEACLPHL